MLTNSKEEANGHSIIAYATSQYVLFSLWMHYFKNSFSHVKWMATAPSASVNLPLLMTIFDQISHQHKTKK